MRYISTRGEAPELGFCDCLLTGLAEDGGLYLPRTFPHLTHQDIAALAGQSYADVAYTIIHPFIGAEIEDGALKAMIDEAYGTFRHEAVVPLVQTGPNEFVAELFHGPTLAFKDVAMQLIARLMDHVLEERGQRATIVGATSGDTGGAALDAFKGRARTDTFILYPHGRVSDVQRRQMTTLEGEGAHALAIDGSFDDCQAIVKAMFVNKPFREAVALSGVNSINWARIVAQVVYYFTTAVSLGAPHRAISFTVPTGNFGDILAGWVAREMGLPIERLVIATNTNDILARALETGRYQTNGVTATISPSMDIEVSSNFERLLFAATAHDHHAVRRMVESLKQSGGFHISEDALTYIRAGFDAERADEAETAATIGHVMARSGYLLDPHTAVGVTVARKLAARAGSGEGGFSGRSETPMVVLGTAHPAKFPDAVEAASSVRPGLPAHLADLHDRIERFTRLAADQRVVEDFVKANARAVIA